MRLLSLRLRNVGVFADTTVALADDARTTRPVTVLFGADGIGKTTLLTALSAPPEEPSYAVSEWLLGEDDPERPHALVVASPTAVLEGEGTDARRAAGRSKWARAHCTEEQATGACSSAPLPSALRGPRPPPAGRPA